MLLKKVLILILAFIALIFSYLFFFNDKEVTQDTFEMKTDLQSETVESLLLTGFEQNSELTVGQLLVFYSRLYGNDVKTYREAQDFCVLKNIYLPSDLIYNAKDWENLWRDIVLGNTVFEKVNEDIYAISLIKGYLTIYLNEQGYDLIKQGLIPPQLYFYSPFSSLNDLEEINLNKKADWGFALELLMSVECDDENRNQIIRDIIVNKIESLTYVEEADWGTNEIALYNYYSLSYYGEYSYLKDKGYIEKISVEDLTKPVSISDFIILSKRIIK